MKHRSREGLPVMAVKVYLGNALAAHGEITYDDADAFSVTAGGFVLIQRQHSGVQKDLAVFAPGVWRHAEVVHRGIQVRRDLPASSRSSSTSAMAGRYRRGPLAANLPDRCLRSGVRPIAARLPVRSAAS
jgi:hypothetical protein